MQGRGLVEVFHVRRLLWDEIHQYANPAELEELQCAIGSHLIHQNKELREELMALVEILTQFQQANDDLRDALMKRQRLVEPPGRTLLMNKLRMMLQSFNNNNDNDDNDDNDAAADDDNDHTQLDTRGDLSLLQDKDLVEYILKTTTPSHANTTLSTSSLPLPIDTDAASSSHQGTPRMKDIHDLHARAKSTTSTSSSSTTTTAATGVFIRPGTASAKRPHTANSTSTNTSDLTPRPLSRGSTLSTASAPAVLEQIQLQRQLNVDQIDAIQRMLSDALHEEQQQLLDDIEFIQGCLEMEKDLIDEDQRQVKAKQHTPTLTQLHEFCRNLEKTLQTQQELQQTRKLLDRADSFHSTSTRTSNSNCTNSATGRPVRLASLVNTSVSSSESSSRNKRVKEHQLLTHKFRQAIQEARDLPFLT